MPGIVSSSVGYTGGTSQNPTYRTVCRGDGHTEAVRLVYDPKVISYEEIMRHVLRDASTRGAKPQYKSAVWAQNEEQLAIVRRVAEKQGKSAVPVLAPTKWWDAEEYHQKYVEKSRGGAACGWR